MPATMSYNDATHMASLTTSSPLSASTAYTAKASGAADSSGNTMAPFSWSFTTAAAATRRADGDVAVAGLGGVGRAGLGVGLGHLQRGGAAGDDRPGAHGPRGRGGADRCGVVRRGDADGDGDADVPALGARRRTRRRSAGRPTRRATRWPRSPGPSPPRRRSPATISIWGSLGQARGVGELRRQRRRGRRQVPLRRGRDGHRGAVLQGQPATPAPTSATSGRPRARCWPRPPSPARRPRAGSRSTSPRRWRSRPTRSYVASYYAPKGHYADDRGYFALGRTAARCTSRPSGGVLRVRLRAAASRPDWKATNYWVDVVFNANPTAVGAAKTIAQSGAIPIIAGS